MAALVMAAVWYIRYRSTPYPFASGILLTLPFLVDTASNAHDLYDSIVWRDDANHLINRALLLGAIGAPAVRSKGRPWGALAYVVGFGAVTAILWEVAEYFAFIRRSPELDTAYIDTLGDLSSGLMGSALAGFAAAALSAGGPSGLIRRNKNFTST